MPACQAGAAGKSAGGQSDTTVPSVLAGRARKRRHPAPVRADRSGQLVTRSESGIDTIVRRAVVSYMSRVFLAVVNAVQARRNAADEEHEDRH